MKLICTREEFLDPLQTVVGGIVDRKNTNAILASVLVEVSETGLLKMTGTDTEIELTSQLQLPAASVVSAGAAALPGRKLLDICRALPENTGIRLQCTQTQAVLNCGKSKFTLATLNPEDFPQFDSDVGGLSFQLSEEAFLHLLHRTQFAIAQQDVRSFLRGMLLEINGNKLTAVASDGHRLAIHSLVLPEAISEKKQFIVPRKAVLELIRLLDSSQATITIKLSPASIQVHNERFTFSSKLIEGRFPDYLRAIPRGNKKHVSVDNEHFKEALSRAAILSAEKVRGVRMELKPGLLTLQANNPEQEFAEEEISTDYQDQEVEIGFNVTYLIDVVNALKSKVAEFSFSDPAHGIFFEEGGESWHSLYLVMPLKL